MSERPWFKCYPSDFLNGVSDLSPNELAVYTVVLMRMYDEGGSILDEPERIARRCNMRLPACKKALDALCNHGKLAREDGLLCNDRAQKEIETRHKHSTKQASNASKRWQEGPEKDSKINDGAVPPHSQNDADGMPTRDQKPEARSQKENIEDPDGSSQVARKRDDPGEVIDYFEIPAVMDRRSEAGKVTDYPPPFEAVWQPVQAEKANHNTALGSKREAFLEWKRHARDVPADVLLSKWREYCADCRRTDTNTKNFHRWIKYHGWEDDYGPPMREDRMVSEALQEMYRREEDENGRSEQDRNPQLGGPVSGKRALAGSGTV